MRRYLVTGGCGFIGRRLIEQLLRQGNCAVRILDNLSTGDLGELQQIAPVRRCSVRESLPDLEAGEPIQLIAANITDRLAAVAAAAGVDAIIHLAANAGVPQSLADPDIDCQSNVVGTLSMLEAARHQRVRRFVFASSGAPVGECQPPIHEELACHPVSPYGASKLAGEGYCSAYFRSFGIETVALRFGNVYGPGSGLKTSVVAKFIRQALRGETLEVYGDGSQTRDYIFIDDIVAAIQLAATVDGVGGQLFQIATNRETSLNELLQNMVPELRSQLGIEVDVRFADPRPGDVARNFSDTTKARQLLGWHPQTTLADGIRATIDWFATARNGARPAVAPAA